LPNVGPYIYIYTTLKFLALQGTPYFFISRLRVNFVNYGLTIIKEREDGIENYGLKAWKACK
jgi:hypothetical protein